MRQPELVAEEGFQRLHTQCVSTAGGGEGLWSIGHYLHMDCGCGKQCDTRGGGGVILISHQPPKI